jgi:phage terminase small subunit
MGISLRAYARMRGCSLTAVQKAIASKRITTLADGTIDPERANQQWAKNTFAGQTINRQTPAPKPRNGSAQPKASSQPVIPQAGEVTSDPVAAYLRARAVNETFKAKVSQLEYEERTGKLIQAVRASEYAATFSAIVKDSLMAMPDRLAPMLAAVDDEKAIHRILAAEVSTLLRKVSKAVADAGL